MHWQIGTLGRSLISRPFAFLTILFSLTFLAALDASAFGPLIHKERSQGSYIVPIADSDTLVTLTNTTKAKILVVAIGADRSRTPLFEIEPGASIGQRLAAGIRLAFAQGGAWVGATHDVGAGVDEIVSLPIDLAQLLPPADAQPAGAPSATLPAATVRVTNQSTGVVGVLELTANNEQTPLFNLNPGQTADAPATPGNRLAFSQNGDWLGSAYTVKGAAGEAVAVPFDSAQSNAGAATTGQTQASAPEIPAEVQRQSAAGSRALTLTNGTAEKVDVIITEADGSASYVLASIEPAAAAKLKAQPNTILYLVKSGTVEPMSDSYTVTTEASQAIRIPLLPLAVRQQSGPGSVPLMLRNTSGGSVDALIVTPDGSASFVLVTLEVNSASRIRALPGTKLFLVKSGTTDPVGLPYVVASDGNQSVSIPLLTALQKRNSGPLSRPVIIANKSAEPVSVAMVDENNVAEEVVLLPPFAANGRLESLQVSLAPGTLYFYNPTTKAPVGKPYNLTADDTALLFPVPPAFPLAMRDPAGPALTLTNRTTAIVTVARLFERDGAPASEAVAELQPGEAMTGQLAAGTKLAFFDANQNQVGGGYLVRSDAKQAVDLPYDAASAAIAKAQSVPNFVTVFQRPGNPRFNVFFRDETGGEAKFMTVEANGQPFGFAAAPGTQIVFRDAQTNQAISEVYTATGLKVGDQPETIDVPYVTPTPAQRKHRGAGAIALTIKNSSDTPMFVAVEDNSGGQASSETLGHIQPQGGRTLTVLPKSRLWFYNALSNKPMGGNYDVLDAAKQAVTAPLATGASNDPDRGKFIGPQVVNVRIQNTTPEPVYVIARNETGVKSLLYELEASQTLQAPINPNVVIWFTKKGTPETFGQNLDGPVGLKLPYVVSSAAQQNVVLPYQLSDSEFEKLVLVDLETIKKETLATINKTNKIAIDSKDLPVACWKNTQVRDVGKIPVKCKAGEQDSGDGLCYDRCRSGYTNFVTMCIPDCPAGFVNDGLYCRKPSPYKRREYPISASEFFRADWSMQGSMARCKAVHGNNCVIANGGTIVYETCRPGYQQAPVITNLCTPTCPSTMIDIGVSCQKKTYDRGVGRLKQCDTNQDTDAGLCYRKCNAGYTGVGPVCWAQCPAKLPTNCGTTCAATTAACAMAVSDQVMSPLLAVGNIVLTVVTVGTATGAQVGAKAGITAAKTTGVEVSKQLAKTLAKEAAKDAAKATLKKNIKAALQLGPKVAVKTGSKVVAKEAAIDVAISTALTGVITGLQQVPWRGIDAARNDLEVELQVRIRQRLAREVSDAELDTIINAAMAAVEEANPGVEFPWTALDPSGIGDIVMAYNLPMCADVK
jgi:hypothetical protein